MFGILCALLFLQCVFASPVDEETIEYREWVPSRVAYARDFDKWFDFDWVPAWNGNSQRVRPPTVKERVLALENRQKALFDLVRCESYGQTDCSLFRTEAETVFGAPSRGQNLTPPTKADQSVTPANQPTNAPVTAAPVTAAPVTAAPVTAAPVTAAPVTAAPVTAAPVTAAPVTAAPESNTVAESTTVPSSSVAPASENANQP